jgi:hypothetical protein
MATKAQRFRYQMERAAHEGRPRAAGRRPARRGPPKDPVPNPTAHNRAPRATKNALYELEVSATTRPPRKSTRRSPTHIKTDSALRITAMNRNATPVARAGRRTGNPH